VGSGEVMVFCCFSVLVDLLSRAKVA